MKKAIPLSIALLVLAWFGVPWLVDEAFREYIEIEIAGDYYLQAMSDDYAEIYNKKTGFSIPIRVVWHRSDTRFIAVIRKEQANLDFGSGPCEYYVIDHVIGKEYVKLTTEEISDLLQDRPELARFFELENGQRCNTQP